ncbi:MAG: cupredoxin family copper-binding protein [Gammaproteobacteria bacterium]
MSPRKALHVSGAPLRGALLASLVLTTVANATPPATKSAQPRMYIVTIEGLAFKPASLSVQRGDRIRWINQDLFPHSATAAGGLFDSKAIQASGSWTWVAQKPGTIDYVCSFHPMMKGTLTVR